ncbi:MAG: hypothetical protein P0Y53_09005 [Candidatus Pseudobacter hemicellulosilyticus]|uniref:Uncharacterized protein n=1 Tax=Candidatus Pseudobacter hemicellulosilyticus TaxID=3121375 RepID=A0AAJ6BHD7_9BACT|nr:MAG: hypothetical protein P0Y53_09005 [Pseudobacter sp.]
MESLFRLLLFLIFAAGIGLAGFLLYRYFNQKIIGSVKGWQLVGYAILMILANAILLLGGIYLLYGVYAFFAE